MTWSTVQPIEVYWLVRCLVGAALVGRLLHLAANDDLIRRTAGKNGALAIQAHMNLWTFRLLLAVQLVGVLLVVPALFLEPRTEDTPGTWAAVSSVLGPLAIVAVFHLLDVLALLKWRTRHEIDDYLRADALRDLAAARRAGAQHGRRRSDTEP